MGTSSGVYELLALGRRLDVTATGNYVLIFGIGCAVTSALILCLDLCTYLVRGRSFLRLRHSPRQTLLQFVAMPLAAGIVGMMGLALDFLQASRAASIAVGFAWPFVLAALTGAVEGIATDDDDLDEGGEPLR